jgi:hypothetical protein
MSRIESTLSSRIRTFVMCFGVYTHKRVRGGPLLLIRWIAIFINYEITISQGACSCRIIIVMVTGLFCQLSLHYTAAFACVRSLAIKYMHATLCYRERAFFFYPRPSLSLSLSLDSSRALV